MRTFIGPNSHILLGPGLLANTHPAGRYAAQPRLICNVTRLIGRTKNGPFLKSDPTFNDTRKITGTGNLLPLTRTLDLPVIRLRKRHCPARGPRFSRLHLSGRIVRTSIMVGLPGIGSRIRLAIALKIGGLFNYIPNGVGT